MLIFEDLRHGNMAETVSSPQPPTQPVGGALPGWLAHPVPNKYVHPL